MAKEAKHRVGYDATIEQLREVHRDGAATKEELRAALYIAIARLDAAEKRVALAEPVLGVIETIAGDMVSDLRRELDEMERRLDS